MAGNVRRLPSGRYQARFPRARGKRFTSRTFDRKIDAERWLAEQNVDRDQGMQINPRGSAATVGEVAQRFSASRTHLAPSTQSRDKTYLNLICDEWGEVPLGRVRNGEVQEWVDSLDMAPSTRRHVALLFGQVLDRAVADRLIATSPLRLSLPRAQRSEQRFLAPPEIATLAGCIDEHYKPLMMVAVLTGLRWGELLALSPASIDPEGRSLTVSASISEVNGQFARRTPKTAAGMRNLALSDSAITYLESVPFLSPEGRMIRRSNFRRRIWLPAVNEAGLSGLRFHDLRHTHASLLIAAGEHPLVISRRLGHSGIQVTMDRYGHLIGGLDRSAASKLDALNLDDSAQ